MWIAQNSSRGLTLDVISSLVMGDFQCPREACLTAIADQDAERTKQISSSACSTGL